MSGNFWKDFFAVPVTSSIQFIVEPLKGDVVAALAGGAAFGDGLWDVEAGLLYEAVIDGLIYFSVGSIGDGRRTQAPKVPKFIFRISLSASQPDDLSWACPGTDSFMRRLLQKILSVALMGMMLATPLMLNAQGRKGGKGGGGRGAGRKKAGSRKKGGN